MRWMLVALLSLYPLAAQVVPAGLARERTDPNSRLAHQQLLAKKTQGRIDIYFEGDSITRRWGATDYPQLLDNWRQNFHGWNAADFGWGADRIENILWRLDHGELDGVNPKIVVLLAGTNNIGTQPPADVAQGIQALLNSIRAKAPTAVVILMAIFPRNDNLAFMPVIDEVNRSLAQMADGRAIRFLDINAKLAGPGGRLKDGHDELRDKLHPLLPAYQIWADALKPIIQEILGPPAAEDHAPPPTGNPAASPKRN